tara:strand:+ start:780 stop:1115 length:336 start_codon:yes stop_codon:yes gene_type:complete
MNYLYFAEGYQVNSTGEGMTLPASRFIGTDAISSTTTNVFFGDHDNGSSNTTLMLTHVANKHKEVIELMTSVLKPSPGNRGKFIVVADEEHGIYLDNGNGAGISGVVEVHI